MYVFAMSVSKEFNGRLIDLSRKEQGSDKGYSFLPGYPNEEVICF